MQNMSREDLLALIDDIRQRVAAGDSFEGNLQYLMPEAADAQHPFDVAAAYRIGNTMGQGGMVAVGTDTREELKCRRCGDTDGPFKQTDTGYLCEPCLRGGAK